MDYFQFGKEDDINKTNITPTKVEFYRRRARSNTEQYRT